MSANVSRLHSIESEQSVIGALLLDPLSSDSMGALRPEHCYHEAHRIILTEIMSMIAAGRPVDVITVAEALHDKGTLEKAGELSYLGELAANTPGSANVRRYAEIVVEKALERQLLAAADEIISTVGGIGSTREKLMAAQTAVMRISDAVATRSPKMLRELLITAAETLMLRSKGNIKCIPTGFIDLDAHLSGGLRPGNLIVVAGRPGMGKTSLVVNIAHNVSRKDIPVLFLSMEMPEQEVADRLIAQTGSVFLSDVLIGKMSGKSGDHIMSAVEKLNPIPLVIDDQGGLTLFDVASKARSVKRKYGLSLLVIDYLQLMAGDSDRDNRNQQIEQITRGLKSLAKELEIPIIALSQLSRKCEERTNKRPMNSDLRESGAIEQDADLIMLIYRDEEYFASSSDKGTAEINISKNRNGKTGMVRMSYQGYFTRFNDLDPGWQPEQQTSESGSYKRRKGMVDD